MAELFQLQIITPDRVFYDGQASMVEMNTGEGEMGVYAKHLSVTTTLEPGIVRIHEESGVKEAAVYSGFVVILQLQPEKCPLRLLFRSQKRLNKR